MNLWVLFLCRFFLHNKVKTRRIIAASFLAALGEVVIVCIPFGTAGVKLILGFGLVTAMVVAWLFQPRSLKYYYKLLAYSYVSALLFGSAFLVLETIFGRKKISLSVWGICTVFFFVFIKKIYGKVSAKSEFGEVVLKFEREEQCTVNALVDSGNGLIEPISKNPVSLVEEKAMAPYKKYLKKENFRVVPYHSIGNAGGILEAYFIEEMEIKKDGERIVIKNPLIAITKEVISVNERYQMILHPTILKQGGMDFDF